MATALRNHRRLAPEGTDKSTPSEKSFRGFLTAVLRKDYQTLFTVYKAAMGENSGLAGGYIVPTEYSTQLLQTLEENAFIFPRTTVVPMGANEILLPALNAETAPAAAGTSPFFGGISFTWQPEAATISEVAEPTFRQKSLTAKDMVGYAKISNQLHQDIGPGGDQFFLDLFGKAAAWYVDYAILNGTGTDGNPIMGLLNAPGSTTVNRKTSSQVASDDIALMAASLLPGSWRSSIWVTHPTTLKYICNFANFVQNQFVTEATEGHIGFLLGNPLYVSEKVPKLGTQGDLVLFDPVLYVVGQRQEVVVDVSQHVLFNTYQTIFRIWLRMAGEPWLATTVTLQDATSVVAGCVILK